jgi:uncharacterized protein
VTASSAVEMRWGVRIPLRDGVLLNATLYLPSGTSAAPAVVLLTPYISQTYHDRGLYFAAHGYPFLAVDVRVRGNSEGEFRPLINEAKDGYDVIEWLAQQSYCNGQIAMWGGSYSGYAQWAAANEFPPHLTTIVPVAAPYVGADFPVRANLPTCYLMQWLTLVWNRTSQDKLFWNNHAFWNDRWRQWFESGAAFCDLDRQLGNPSSTFREWIAHPQLDDYWDGYNPSAQSYAKLLIPVLTITGMYDGDQPGALMHYRQHIANAAAGREVQHYLIIGPWDHAGTRTPSLQFGGLEFGPDSIVDLGALHREWYAWTMQRGPKPQFLQKKVAYYVAGAEHWRYADTLDEITARSAPLFLESTNNPTDIFSSGSLSPDQSAGGGPDHYLYDPQDVSLAQLESTLDPHDLTQQSMLHAAIGKQLVYHSAAFERDCEISGFFRLVAWLSIDQPDTDFRVSVYEIQVDGTSVLLTTDSMRARYRESLREGQLISSTEPLCYEFNRFMFVARELKARHRLRLVIGPINSIHSQKNYNSGRVVAEEKVADARLVNVRLFHDQRYPSALYVPYGRPKNQAAADERGRLKPVQQCARRSAEGGGQ